jgi:hypothetical protein
VEDWVAEAAKDWVEVDLVAVDLVAVAEDSAEVDSVEVDEVAKGRRPWLFPPTMSPHHKLN